MSFDGGGGFKQATPTVVDITATTLEVSNTASVPNLTTQYSRDTSAHTGLTSTSFVTVGAALVTVTLPASGVLAIWHKTRITTGVSGQTYSADVIVKNTTASTTPYAGSFNNCSDFTGTATPFDVTGFIAVGAGGMGGTLGATGDTITVQIAYAVTGGTWAIGDTAIMVTPSL